jgi:hypothetical protein
VSRSRRFGLRLVQHDVEQANARRVIAVEPPILQQFDREIERVVVEPV